MEFNSYITYDEYVEYGGKLPEDTFTQLERKAQRWLDFFTFNRIPQLTTIPDVVKECLVEFITRLNILDTQRQSGDVISSYSNGVETIQYQLKTDAEIKQELYGIAMDWLPDYLVCRSVNFDVSKYLQSDSNNS
nr:MAG TPA: Head Tail Connector Protein [Caudoviricetes sp.]